MCILCGCDYLDNIKKVGVTTAHKLVSRYKSTDRILRALHFEGNLSVPKEYEKKFARAKLTFKHHLIFDPRSRSCAHLNPVPKMEKNYDISFCGPPIPDDIAAKIADGDIDPFTHAHFPSREKVESHRGSSVSSSSTNIFKKTSALAKAFAHSTETRGMEPSSSSSSSLNNVFARRGQQTERKRKYKMGSMDKYLRRNLKTVDGETEFKRPRSEVLTKSEQKEQQCPNSADTSRSKYFSTSSSSPESKKSGTQNELLQSLKMMNKDLEPFTTKHENPSSSLSTSSLRQSVTQGILNRVSSSTLRTDSIGKRFDPISTRSIGSLDRFSRNNSMTTNGTSSSSTKRDDVSLEEFSRKEDEITPSQIQDFKSTTALMTSPDRVVNATAVNLLDDTSFDSLESPAQVIPETPPHRRRSPRIKKKKNLASAFRLSKFTFTKKK